MASSSLDDVDDHIDEDTEESPTIAASGLRLWGHNLIFVTQGSSFSITDSHISSYRSSFAPAKSSLSLSTGFSPFLSKSTYTLFSALSMPKRALASGFCCIMAPQGEKSASALPVYFQQE